MSIFIKKAPLALSKKSASKPAPRKLVTVKERRERLKDLDTDSDDSGLLSVETVAPDPPFAGLGELLKKRDPFPKQAKQSLIVEFMEADLSRLTDNEGKKTLLKIQQGLKHTKGKGKGKSSPKLWTGDFMADELVGIVQAYESYQSFVACNRSTRNKIPAIAMLDDLLEKFSIELDKERAKKEAILRAEAKKKIAKAKKSDGVRPQEDIEFDRFLLLSMPCPNCKHFNTMHLQSIKEIEEFNQQVEDEYQKKKRRYAAYSVARQQQEKKPRKGKIKSREIGCFCFKIHCMDMPNGGNCSHCKNSANLNASGVCADCCICACDCSIVFVESERKAIADSVDPKEIESRPPTNGRALLYHLEDIYASKVKEVYLENPTASKEQIARDAHSSTFHEVLSDPVFASAEARKKLQEDMGPLETTTKDGKTVHQLRAQKRGVTLDPTGDSRFFRNRLQEHPMDQTRFLRNSNTANPLPLSPIKSILSETPSGEIGSSVQPISIDGADGASKLLSTPSRRELSSGTPPSELSSDTPPSELSSDTPPFLRSMREAANEKADFQENSQPTLEILDRLGDTLTAENNSPEASRIKRKATDLAKRGKDPEECLPKMVDWCKRQKIPAKDKK